MGGTMGDWPQMGSTMGACRYWTFHFVGIGKYAVWSEPTLASLLLICLLSSKGAFASLLRRGQESWLLSPHLKGKDCKKKLLQLIVYFLWFFRNIISRNLWKHFYIWKFSSMQGGSFLPGRVDCCVNVISANHANVASRPILHFKENFFFSSQLWPFKCLMSGMKLNTL